MSKAFDTVKRNNLMELLGTILAPDETHMKILLKDVKLSVRIEKEFGGKITTNIGVPQGDCLSPILFTFYLADALKTERSTITEEHNYSKIPMNSEHLLQEHLKDLIYNLPKKNGLLIDQQYADDTGQVAVNAKHRTEKIKKRVPAQLNKKTLQVNKQKQKNILSLKWKN